MMQRIRVTYSKREEVQYTSNLDMQKIWERLLRRAKLPIAYSHGFHPQPRINQGCPLPLGITSNCELLDFWLTDDLNLDEIGKDLRKAAPPGILITNIAQIQLDYPALQTCVLSASYLIRLMDKFTIPNLEEKITRMLLRPTLVRERRGKKYDLRPLIEDLTVNISQNEENPEIIMRLAAREGATGRPDEVLSELGIEISDTHVERVGIILKE